MAVENEHVSTDVIDAPEFPELTDRFAVRSVPKVVLNDVRELVGSQRETAFVEAVIDAAPV